MADKYIGDGVWTYGNDPESSTRDETRFLCGDCVSHEQYLTDTEIAYCIAKEDTIELAAARAAESIARKLAPEMSMGAEGLSGSLDQRRRSFMETAKELRRKYGLGVPEAGGIDRDQNDALDDEDDIVLIPFSIGMHDDPTVYDNSRPYDIED